MHQKILESLTDIIYLINDQGRVVYTNKKGELLNFTDVSDNFFQSGNKSYYRTIQEIIIDQKKYKLCQYKECTEIYQMIVNQKKDAITKLANRLVVDQYLEQLKVNGNHGVIAMVDIDFFKSINDTYGHLFGDKILRQLAAVIRSCINENDFIGRYGGEEFIVVLNHRDLRNSLIELDIIRKKVESYFNNPNYNITISIGAAEFDKKDSIIEKLKEADSALYHVKDSGRNNIGFLNNYDNEYIVINAPKQNHCIRKKK